MIDTARARYPILTAIARSKVPVHLVGRARDEWFERKRAAIALLAHDVGSRHGRRSD